MSTIRSPLQHPDDGTAVSFAGRSRLHVSLPVRDLERTRAFYERLLGAPPTKVRPGLVKFDLDEPSVNLALNQTRADALAPSLATGAQHFGIQVERAAEVAAARDRLSAAGYPTELEERNECCHSVQTKVWVEDPDGRRWEIFVVVDDLVDRPAGRPAEVEAAAAAGCCESLEGCG